MGSSATTVVPIRTGHLGHQPTRRNTWRSPRNKILELLRERGQNDQAEQADKELPHQVDPDQHGDLLAEDGTT